MTTVANVRTDAFDVYIGRRAPRGKDPRCRVPSEFYNPFIVGKDAADKADAVEKYEGYIRAKLADSPEMRIHLWGLRGKVLGCWCAPEPCHGEVLIKIIGELESGKMQL